MDLNNAFSSVSILLNCEIIVFEASLTSMLLDAPVLACRLLSPLASRAFRERFDVEPRPLS